MGGDRAFSVTRESKQGAKVPESVCYDCASPFPIAERFKEYARRLKDTDDERVLAFLVERAEFIAAERGVRVPRSVRMDILYRHFLERNFRGKLNAVLGDILGVENFDLMGALRKEWRSTGEKRFMKKRGEFDEEYIDFLGQCIITSKQDSDNEEARKIFHSVRLVLTMEFLHEEVHNEERGEEGSIFAHYLQRMGARAYEWEEKQIYNGEILGNIVGEAQKISGDTDREDQVIHAEKRFSEKKKDE